MPGTSTIHATFNWNPLYDSYIHVAMWGNDATGDGTKKYPYRTIKKAFDSGATLMVIGSGVYREPTFANPGGDFTMVADGNVIIDVTDNALFSVGAVFRFTGLYFRGAGGFVNSSGVSSGSVMTNCTFDNTIFSSAFYTVPCTNCTFLNFTGINVVLGDNFIYCTFFNCTLQYGSQNNGNGITKCIFKDCYITFSSNPYNANVGYFSYNNLYNTYLKLLGTSTYVLFTDLGTLKAAVTAAGATQYTAAAFSFVYFIDPMFNNEAVGDLTLAITSPCKNMASDGTLIGAHSIGVNLIASTTSATSAFDNSSAVNITIDATSGALTLTDNTQNASIVTKPIANLSGRNIASLSTFGFYSDRNGEYIDSTADLDYTGLYAAGDALTTDRVYLVDDSGGQIVYNTATLAVGDRFTCKSAASTFTNVSVDAFVREIIEAPTRNNIEARFSNGTGTFKTNGQNLTTGYWYYLSAGTATLSSVSYTAGQYIKGDGTAVTLTGATLEEVFTTDAYQFYESFGGLTCNKAGNVSTGAVTKGNGDPAFDRTTANIFKLAYKHIQIRYTIQVANLIP